MGVNQEGLGADTGDGTGSTSMLFTFSTDPAPEGGFGVRWPSTGRGGDGSGCSSPINSGILVGANGILELMAPVFYFCGLK